MDRYIALDSHAQSTTCAVVSPSGRRMQLDVVETKAEPLVELVRSIGGRRHLCIEEGTQSGWLYELLLPHVDELVVTMPRRRRGPKSDAADAWALAEEFRVGTLERCVYKGLGAFARLRQAVRVHRMLTRDATRVKNRIRSMYRSRGVEAGDEVLSSTKRDAKMALLPAEHREVVAMLNTEHDVVQQVRAQAEAMLLDEASHHAVIDRLATIPGIGKIRASYIAAVVVTPHRFRSKRQFWAYCGFAVMTESSADWEKQQGRWVRARTSKTRGLNRDRNSILKDVFKGAALNVMQLDDAHPLKSDYLQLCHRGLKPTIARIAIARRLAAMALALWKNEEVYDPAKRYRPPQNA